MKRIWLLSCMIFVLLLAAFVPQQALGLMEKMDPSQLTARADLIVVGQVKGMESRWDPGETIFTYVTIAVEQSEKGSSGAEVTLRFPGGEVGEIGLRVSDSPVFQKGEKVKVFLKGKETYDIVGLYQGKHTITEGEGAAPPGPGFDYDGKHWPGPNPMGEDYLINPNCADAEAGTADDQIIAIRDGAARAWMNEGNANFSFTYGGTTTKQYPDDGVVGNYNGFNEIMFVQDPNYWLFDDHPSYIAVVWLWYNPETLEIGECDMAFNDENFVFNGVGQPTSSEHDIWNIATHEFGHFLKLGDLYGAGDSEKTMYGYGYKGETKARDLHQDDIDGIQYIYGAASNTNPVLSYDYVSPPSGYADTEFAFYVNYYDANGDAPSTAQVYINDTPHTMSLYTGSASNGKYRYQTTLPERGTYSYYFYFEEGNGGSDREPVLWTNTGPTVVNSAPTLSDGYVTPLVGPVINPFDFYVSYFDLDEDAPSLARVYIDGSPYSMDLYSGSASDGVYHYQSTLTWGDHSFYFYFEDGQGGSRRLPTSGTYSLTAFVCGDASGDGDVNLVDIVYLVNYVLKGGPEPDPLLAGYVSGDDEINLVDIVYLVNYVLKGGPAPVCP